MREIKQILVGTDFSTPSEEAIAHAIDLAQRFGARLVLLHVYQMPIAPVPEAIGPLPTAMMDGLVAENRTQLERLAERVRAAGVPVVIEQVFGAPSQEICARAERDIDLVVLGTHGRHGLRHALLGSVAEHVVRDCIVPVLTIRVPPGAHPTEHAHH